MKPDSESTGESVSPTQANGVAAIPAHAGAFVFITLFLCRLIETNRNLIFFPSSISVANIFVPQVSHSRNVLTFLDPMTLYPETLIIILSQMNSDGNT